jgi:trigger factor
LEKTVRSPKEWLREIDVEVEPEKLRSRLETMLNEYQDRAKLPGFRPGHVPRRILEKRIGGELQDAAVEEIVEDAVEDALADKSFRPASRPRFMNLEVTPDKAVRFQISIEVIPDFELKQYDGLRLKKQEPTGFEAEFERRLQALREKCGTFKPLSRPAANGDFVVVDYRTWVGETEAGKPRANVMMQLGDEMTSAEVNQALTGARPGDERTTDIVLPADYNDKKLAGKTMTYRFVVRDVKERILPELTEEFARDLGFDSLDKLRIEINEEILTDRAKLVENGLKNQIFDLLTGEHSFEPPESWVKASAERLQRQYELPDDEETRAKLLPLATKWARFDCTVARIADKESIHVSDEEVATEIKTVAETTKRSPEEIAEMLDGPAYRNQLLRDKVMQFILDKAETS